MIERRPPFGAGELPEAETAGDLATSLAMGRELETLASEPVPPGSDDFSTRVMAAIATEPVPQPVTVAARALRAGRPIAALAAVRDAWRVAWSGPRPFAVRAQALALVLVAVVGLASIGTAGAVGVAGALGLLNGDAPAPSPVVPVPSPSVSPSPTIPPTPSPEPSVVPTPSAPPPVTEEPTDTASPDDTEEPLETEELETPDSTADDNSGPGGGGDDPPGDDSSGPGSG